MGVICIIEINSWVEMVELIATSFCFLTFIGIILIILLAYIKKKKKLESIESKIIQTQTIAGLIVKKMNISTVKLIISSIVLLFAVLIAVLFSYVFIYTFIGDYVWFIFVGFVIYYLVDALYFVIKNNRLDDLSIEKFGFIYDFVDEKCKDFGIRKPTIKIVDSLDINAYTTSFFGRKSVVVIHRGLLNSYLKGGFSKEELMSIVGHEIGHIVNGDATITTLLRPMIAFVNGVKNFLRFIILSIINIIKITVLGSIGSGSIIGIIFGIGIALLLIILLIFVGIFFALFWFLAYLVFLLWNLFSRMGEYAADIFGSIAIGSPVTMSIGLMNLHREIGVSYIRDIVANNTIKNKIKNGEINSTKLINPLYFRSVRNQIDVYTEIKQNPGLIDQIPSEDSKFLLKLRGLNKFSKKDCESYSKLKIRFLDKLRALVSSHPQGYKRIKSLLIKDVIITDDKIKGKNDKSSEKTVIKVKCPKCGMTKTIEGTAGQKIDFECEKCGNKGSRTF